MSAQAAKPSAAAPTPLLKIENLRVHFPVTRGRLLRREVGTVRAVDGVSLELQRGETLGLVGESGCGKSTLARAIMRLVPVTEGRILLEGEDLLALRGEALRQKRRAFQMIFQDPFASLNPGMTIGDSVAEPLCSLTALGRTERESRVAELLERCGLAAEYARHHPSELSGGQRQRVAIARALAVQPALLVADEPVSALDVSIRAQVLNLLVELQKASGLTCLFIAHDLAAVRQVSDRIAVMYLGRIVELGPAEAIQRAAAHPYTQALASAIPIPDPAKERARQRTVLTGDVPSPINPPSGCRFHPRCPLYAKVDETKRARCRSDEPELRPVSSEQVAACHWFDQGSAV